MSYFPIELDKERSFKFGMKAIDKIEKKFKKPIMAIEGMQNGTLTMQEYAFLFHAGLMHEDKDLTPEKVMDLIDEYSTVGKVSHVFWTAFNENFKTGHEEEEKAEVLVKLNTLVKTGEVTKEEIDEILNMKEDEVKNE